MYSLFTHCTLLTYLALAILLLPVELHSNLPNRTSLDCVSSEMLRADANFSQARSHLLSVVLYVPGRLHLSYVWCTLQPLVEVLIFQPQVGNPL